MSWHRTIDARDYMHIVSRPELSKRTTLGLGGRALAEIWIDKPGDWDLLSKFLEKEGGRPYVLGQGSNLLVVDGQLPFVLIRLANISRVPEIYQTGDKARLRLDCGLNLSRLMRWFQVYGLSGLEGLVGVPGALGGAVAMNAGAYGYELGSVIRSLQVWTLDEGLSWKDRSELEIGYRCLSPFTNSGDKFWICSGLEIELLPDKTENIRKRMRKFYLQKKASQPILARTCGCVFKNPSQRVSAGYLLEQSGFRGYALGGMFFSEQHANFLVNSGRGESWQALEIIELARNEVKRHFGVELEQEVRVLNLS